MKYVRVAIVLLLNMASYSFVFAQTNSAKANELFRKVCNKIGSLTSVQYNYTRNLNYISEDYFHEYSAKVFLAVEKNRLTFDLNFFVDNENGTDVFNGSEQFFLDKKNKTMRLNTKPSSDYFNSTSFLTNSLVTLKNGLPKIVADSHIQKGYGDTLIDAKSYKIGWFILENRTFDNIGEFFPIKIKRSFFYKLIIDEDNYLPKAIVQETIGQQPRDFVLTKFSGYDLKGKSPAENLWYYTTYLNEYKQASKQGLRLVEPGSNAPEFKAQYFNSKENFSLKPIKGKVVLLDFWIKNCGYCIASVPKLNGLLKKYEHLGLKIVGINSGDEVASIAAFYNRQKPLYSSLMDRDNAISKKYGVDAFPTLILIDKAGKIIYAGDAFSEKLEKILKSIL